MGWRYPERPVTGASCSWWGPESGPGSGPSWNIVMTRGHHEQVTWLRGREGPPPYWWPQRPWPGVEQGPQHFLFGSVSKGHRYLNLSCSCRSSNSGRIRQCAHRPGTQGHRPGRQCRRISSVEGPGGPDLVSGGVMALPTLRNWPPRSNRFMELMASCRGQLLYHQVFNC